MSLNSIVYIAFLAIVYAIFAISPAKWRWVSLLFFSMFFYMTFAIPLVFFLFSSILVTYCLALLIRMAPKGAASLTLLWLGIIANILLIIMSRYPRMATSLFSAEGVLLSVGVSYFVFQAISYLIDVHLEVVEPERHLGHFALYLSFFPKLLQGPIERAGDLLPQLKKPFTFDYGTARSGLLLFTWGLFKKVVVADRLAMYVNIVYDDVHAFQGLPLILATYLYAFQLYFDFSGYTDMALGSARLFNIQLTQNFKSPYLATSMADFWRRWHISFSRWILDYIFKPLQISWRNWRSTGTALALLVTFFVSGIWHGVSWGFVVWGVFHGVMLGVSVWYRPLQKKVHKALGVEKTKLLYFWQVFLTFQMVCLGWIFFRANSLRDAAYVVRNSFAPTKGFHSFLFFNGATELVIALVVLIVSLMVKLLVRGRGEDIYFANPLLVRWAGYCFLLLCILLFGVDGNRAFVYFRF